jgi:hypothetical protein
MVEVPMQNRRKEADTNWHHSLAMKCQTPQPNDSQSAFLFCLPEKLANSRLTTYSIPFRAAGFSLAALPASFLLKSSRSINAIRRP